MPPDAPVWPVASIGIRAVGFFDSHIIAILAAILFPVFAKAREKARQTSCLSNLKQMGLALIQYAQDYDERLIGNNNAPCTFIGPDGSTISPNMLWMYQIYPYVKNVQMFNCPSSSNRFTGAYTGNLGYGFNDIYLNRISLGAINVPAETLAFADCTYYLTDWDWSGSADNHVQPALLHNDGSNVAFCDGHAKWFKSSALAYYDNADYAAPPSPNIWDNQ